MNCYCLESYWIWSLNKRTTNIHTQDAESFIYRWYDTQSTSRKRWQNLAGFATFFYSLFYSWIQQNMMYLKIACGFISSMCTNCLLWRFTKKMLFFILLNRTSGSYWQGLKDRPHLPHPRVEPSKSLDLQPLTRRPKENSRTEETSWKIAQENLDTQNICIVFSHGKSASISALVRASWVTWLSFI